MNEPHAHQEPANAPGSTPGAKNAPEAATEAASGAHGASEAHAPAPLSDEHLAAIEARLNSEYLTAAPWPVEYDYCDCSEYGCGHGKFATAFGPFTWIESRDGAFTADAEFAAHAREDVPALLAEIRRQRARITELENALTATGRSLSSFIFDSDDPGVGALGAQWLYHQAMPQADDPFAQPRAFRSSVFSEAAKAVEELDAQAPDDRRDHPQAYLDGYSDGVQDAAERLEKRADQAAEGTEVQA